MQRYDLDLNYQRLSEIYPESIPEGFAKFEISTDSMKKKPIYLAGNWVETDDTINVLSPYDEHVVQTVCMAGGVELETAISAGLKARLSCAQLPSYERSSILSKIAVGIESRKEEIAKSISYECGKPMRYSRGEVDRAIQTFKVASEEAKRLPKEYIDIDWTPSGEGKEGLVKHVPIGLIAGICPFNFPLNLVAHKVAPAIASGCPIIIKPPSNCPGAALILAEIISETEWPAEGLSILPCSRQVGEVLVTDDRIALLSFTGSPDVGWSMKERCGKKKVVLELGGNAAVIVDKSCDLNHAVERILIGGFAYSGQVCIHTQRVYVHSDMFDEFKTAFIEKTQQLVHGDPIEDTTEISCMIDAKNAHRVSEWIEDALDQGAVLLCGDKADGTYVPATVLSNCPKDAKVYAEEVLGPVVIIDSYEHIEDAIRDVNNSRFGLQAGIFTSEMLHAKLAFNSLEVGGLIVNDVPTFRVDHMPYGGIKNSGLGREGLKYAMSEMTEPRLLIY